METLVRAKEQGLARHVGFTCHHDSSALEIMSRAEFSTMLFPINFACSLKNGWGNEALAVCEAKGMGVIAIKSMAQRLWLDGEERTHPKCWYRPIHDNPRLARLALNHTLSKDVATAVPPGDERMIRLALDIIESQGGDAKPLSASELSELTDAALETKELIFSA